MVGRELAGSHRVWWVMPARTGPAVLLAAHPNEWFSIDAVRDELGLDKHVLAGVLSTFPRRWRGRCRQAGAMPYGQEGKGSQRRNRMGKEVAELIRSLE